MIRANDRSLRDRSIRTLAWLGDGEFEREVRLRLVRRGDYSPDRLDKLRAKIVNAESQAELLAALLEQLDEAERGVVRRARNAAVRGGGRGRAGKLAAAAQAEGRAEAPAEGRQRRGIREYRAATGLEALVAWWLLGGQRERFEALLGPAIEARIDALLSASPTS